MKLLRSAALLLSLCLPFAAAAQNPTPVPTPAAEGVDPTDSHYVPPPPPVTDRPIKLVAWNLEHFVDAWDNPYINGEMESTPEVKDPAALESLALALERMDADVLMLTEVEDERMIRLFLDSYLPQHKYHNYACMPSLEWHQNLVIVSKLPMGPVVSFREMDSYNDVANQTRHSYNGRLMVAEIQANPNYSFLLFGAHLKAGSEPKDAVWRREQIKLAKDYCAKQMKLNPEQNIVFLGDMNFTPENDEYKILMDPTTFKFIDPASEIGFQPTHPANAPRRRIDMALFNEPMSHEYVPLSIGVGKPLSTREMGRITDHLPTVISFFPQENGAK